MGLTGGIATGKSTVAQILRDEHNCAVIDADAVSRTLVLPGSAALLEIEKTFGRHVLLPNGTLNRAKLREVIMAETSQREKLNEILHPRIQASTGDFLDAAEKSGANIAFVEAALLVEVGSYKVYDALWVVTCDSEIQISRLMARDNCSRSTAITMIKTQMPQTEKCAVADTVIQNNGDTADLIRTVSNALKQDFSNQ